MLGLECSTIGGRDGNVYSDTFQRLRNVDMEKNRKDRLA